MSKPTGAWRIFRIPLLLAVVSGAGLILALLYEGAVDIAWTVAVAAPLAVIVAMLVRSRRQR